MKTLNRFLAEMTNHLTSNRAFLCGAFSLASSMLSRDMAAAFYSREADKVLFLVQDIDPVHGRKQVKIRKLPGIDENMRSWSIFMTVEHLVITNEMILRIIRSLAREKGFTEVVDIGEDVMPSANPGVEQIPAFRASVRSYEKKAARWGKSRSKTFFRHPIFGMFDVHKWRCMAGFHIYLHRRQVEEIQKSMKTP